MENPILSRREAVTRLLGVTGGVVAALMGKTASAQDCGITPKQTEGPFYPKEDQLDKDGDLTIVQGHARRAQGEVIYVRGQLLDEECKPIPRGLVEIWQACQSGRYNHPSDTSENPLDPDFQYWGRATSNDRGEYLFKTILPGQYDASPTWTRPPHIHVKAFARGYFDLTTQLYFAGNPLNDSDLILKSLPAAERARVIVALTESGEGFEKGSKIGTFDIVMKKVL